MRRVKPHIADALRSRIELGELVLTLEVALMIHGSCKFFEPKPASQPTSARPGSSEKIEILRERVSMGESLWHPDDNATPKAPSGRLEPYLPAIRELSVELSEVA